MNGLSEDDSDSSNEYLIDPNKINLNSNFFTKKKSNVGITINKDDTENESTDNEEFENVTHLDNIELFTQVLKNLENSQKLELNNKNTEKEQSHLNYLTKKNEEEIQKVKEIKITSSNEINELLLQGESNVSLSCKNTTENIAKNEEDAESSNEYTIPKDGVKIILPNTNLIINKRKKGKQDLKAILRKRLKESQILIEKVGLLCWLAYGFYLNRQINLPEILTGVLSLISESNYPKNRIDLSYLEKFTRWFKHIFIFESVESNANKKIDKETLLKIVKEKKISNYKELVLLYIATLRALGLNCRLVISLCPPHRIFSNSPLFKSDVKNEEIKSKNISNKIKQENSKKKKGKKESSDKTNVVQNSPEAKKNKNAESRKRAAEILQNNNKKSKFDTNQDFKIKNKSIQKLNSKITEKKDELKSVENEKNISNLKQLRSRKIHINSKDNEKNKEIKSTDSISKTDDTKSKYYIKESSTDSETEFQPKIKRITRKSLNNTNKKEASQSSLNIKKNNRKLISSDSEDEEINNTRNRQDIWAEIYLDSEESWICVNIMDEKIHCITEIYKKTTKPVLYVVAWNSENLIKDVSRRYCPHWLTVTYKQRIDEKWWLETLSYWKEKDTAISKAEDEMLLQKELEQPLPKTISECKRHPLYVIQKHLLKFEALYPPDCVPLGYTSTGCAIYSRHCVHTLYSRETWYRKARIVKSDQEPYKIVTARPKYDKLSGTKIKNSPLELFGKWQTMEYEPPVAKDGIVPRNEYGNVDLFQPSMLPKGTVHINLPGLYRIARKLNIDCAPAVVGFNFGSMGATPAMEGYVVCIEYEDILREAWEVEQAEAVKRTKEKKDKRVYGNWKRLIQGLFIKERLAAKYEFSEEKKLITNKQTKQKENRRKEN